jgi:hypothetical protein
MPVFLAVDTRDSIRTTINANHEAHGRPRTTAFVVNAASVFSV